MPPPIKPITKTKKELEKESWVRDTGFRNVTETVHLGKRKRNGKKSIF